MDDKEINESLQLAGVNHNKKKRVFFLHSGGSQESHQGSSDLVLYLEQALGDAYEVLFPKMPQPESPEYELWKMRLDKEFAAIEDGIILAGHSLGGSVLLKYLSEQPFEKKIAGLFIVAAPYWGEENWQVDEYILREDFADTLPRIPRIILYHSRNDEVVPFNHLLLYSNKLPNATLRIFDIRGHLFSKGIPELAEDIKNLDRL